MRLPTSLCAVLALAACRGHAPATSGAQPTSPTPSPVPGTAPPPAPASARDAAAPGCNGALFCETFDHHPAVTQLVDGQALGPWRAALSPGATMALEGAHTTSGSRALHVRIDQDAKAGGRLFASGEHPLFAGKPTHLHGRMMMYIEANGTSVHWTFFGVSGPAEPASPLAGRNASYLLSSLRSKDTNFYSFVHGLKAPEGFRDCSSRSETPMPSGWACVTFELDTVGRRLRMHKDGAPILSVDDHGRACVRPTEVTTPWFGPVVEKLYVGAWSFHPMKAPLDVWIDDLVVDTRPVACPAPPVK
jgi:hypothetical protein